MEYVTVADLKARLSEYLRKVEAGEPVVVLRHGVPVARLERISGPQLQVRLPRIDPGSWWTVKGPAVALDRDVLDYLADERADLGEAAETPALPVPGDRPDGPRRTRHDPGRSRA